MITFYKPLTLIVGHNGAGKTVSFICSSNSWFCCLSRPGCFLTDFASFACQTIIECLKQACTGELPPNTRSGQSFIHDPKVAGETEVKAQIKLRFLTSARQPVVIIRSFQLTQKKTTMQFKALDNVLQTRNKNTGEMQALSYRCADIDRIIPSLMGVSKAILENVIFIHQEESNWPLAEGQVLKKKFDDIFAATKYTKALEELRKLKSKQNQELKEMRLRLDHLKTHKDLAARLRADFEVGSQRQHAYQAEVEDLEAQIQKKMAERQELDNKLAAIADLREEVMQLEAKYQLLSQKNASTYARMISSYGEEDLQMTVEEVETCLQDLAPTLDESAGRIVCLKREMSSRAQQIAALKDQYTRDIKVQGRLAAEAEAHTRNSLERDRFVRKVAAELGLPLSPCRGNGASANGGPLMTNEEYGAFKLTLLARVQDLQERFTSARESNRATDDAFASSLDQINAELSGALEGIRMKQDAIKRNEARMDDLNRQLAALYVTSGVLEGAQKQQEDLERQLTTTLSDESVNTWVSEVSRLAGELDHLQSQQKALRRERDGLAVMSENEGKFRVLSKQASEKRGKIAELLVGKESRLRKLLCLEEGSSLPSHGQLKSAAERTIMSLKAQEKGLDVSLKEVQDQKSSVHGSLMALRQQLTGKEAEARAVESALETSSTFVTKHTEDRLSEYNSKLHTKEAEYKRNQQGQMQCVAFENILKQIVKTANENKCCLTCTRGFQTDAELGAFVEKKRGEMEKMPQRKRTFDEALAAAEAELGRLRELKPLADRHHAVKGEISVLQRQISEKEISLAVFTQQTDDISSSLAAACVETSQAMSLVQEVILPVSRLAEEADELESQIIMERDVGASAGLWPSTLRTVREVDADLDILDQKRSEIEAAKEAVSRKVHRHRDTLASLRNESAKAREESVRLGMASERRKTLQTQVQDLVLEINTYKAHIDSSAAERAPLEARKAELEGERASRRMTAAAEEGYLESGLKEVEGLVVQLESRERTVEEYSSSNKAEELGKFTKRLQELKERQEVEEGTIAALETERIALEKEDAEKSHMRRQLEDLLQFKKAKAEEESLSTQLSRRTATAGNAAEIRALHAHHSAVDNSLLELRTLRDKALGSLSAVKESADKAAADLRAPQYVDIENKYRNGNIELKTTEMANSDLDKYHKALEKALLAFHTSKMSDINTIIKELWQKTYRNGDIDYIAIKADTEGGTAARSYNYRVIMKCGGAELDMRGRCSAGQKVLACLIIRLALAETFCLNCGILALDEPTTNLDADNSASLAEALRSIMLARREQENFQLVVITHDEQFARLIGTREHAEHMWRVEKDENQNSTVQQEEIVDA